VGLLFSIPVANMNEGAVIWASRVSSRSLAKRPVELPETAVAASERTLVMGQSEARAGASVFLVPTFLGRQLSRLDFADARRSSTPTAGIQMG
jgi:hypothetical protein